jgi:hypothetical protein
LFPSQAMISLNSRIDVFSEHVPATGKRSIADDCPSRCCVMFLNGRDENNKRLRSTSRRVSHNCCIAGVRSVGEASQALRKKTDPFL